MSCPELHGSIEVTWPKRLDKKEAMRLLTKALRGNSRMDDGDINSISVTDRESDGKVFIDISELYTWSFEEIMEEIIKDIGPHGIKLNGTVNAYGDDDWFWDIHDNKMESYDKTDEGLVYASDGTLIDMLRKRGYTVTKKKKKKGKK